MKSNGDDVEASLLYINKTEEDILLKDQLIELKKEGIIKNLSFSLTRAEF